MNTRNLFVFLLVLGLLPAAALQAQQFETGVDYAVSDHPNHVAIGDLDDDGNLDLVTADWWGQQLSVLLGNGDGTFQAAVGYGVGNDPNAAAIGYLNGDGYLDLVSANGSGSNISLLLGNGDGTFQPAEHTLSGNGPRAVAIGDLTAAATRTWWWPPRPITR